MMKLNTITAAQCAHKTVLLRVDFNVPLTRTSAGAQVKDDRRLQRAIHLIQFLIEQKAKIVLVSHLGRPKNSDDKEFSLAPIATYFREKLHIPMQFVPDTIGSSAQAAVKKISEGEVLLLENLRFYPEEKQNDEQFSHALASLAEVYVNEAFSTCHRAHASVVGITKYLPSFAGFALTEEVTALSSLLDRPQRPFVVVLGGAKISDKVAALRNLSSIADIVLIGGAAANNFLKAAGFEIYRSRTEENTTVGAEDKDYTKVARSILNEHKTDRVLRDGYIPLPKIIFPIDVKAASNIDETDSDGVQTIDLTHDMKDTDEKVPLSYFDIGPKTRKLYSALLEEAGTIFWNGPMGVWENPLFTAGTRSVAQAIARNTGATVIGGGDTIAAAHSLHTEHKYRYVSAAGGAALEFLGGSKLPGLQPLLAQL